jgi:hypothetical protein
MLPCELRSPRVLVAGRELAGVTTVAGHVGGYDLILATTVGPLALDVVTSVVAHPATDTVITHLMRGPALASVKTVRLARQRPEVDEHDAAPELGGAERRGVEPLGRPAERGHVHRRDHGHLPERPERRADFF